MNIVKQFFSKFKKYEFPSPPEKIGDDFILIGDHKFPKDVVGFVNFDYSVLDNVSWELSRLTTWNDKEIKLDLGEAHQFNRIYRRALKIQRKKKIHHRWLKLGYIPTYSRSILTVVSPETPVHANPNVDWWPRPLTKETEEAYFKKRFQGIIFIFWGEAWIQECYYPDPFKENSFIRSICVNAGANSRLFNLYRGIYREFACKHGKFQYV